MKTCNSLEHWETLIQFEDHLDACPLCAALALAVPQPEEIQHLNEDLDELRQKLSWAQQERRKARRKTKRLKAQIKAAQVARIGNSVPPPVACAIAAAQFVDELAAVGGAA